MRRFDVQTPATVRAALSLPETTRDHFLMFDTTEELASNARELMGDQYTSRRAKEWNAYTGAPQAARKLSEGDLSAAAASDAFLARFESYAPETARRAWTDSICGAVPNVPAYVAGHPMNMRRRITTTTESSPLAIIADVAASSGISAEKMAARGAAILALVRALSGRRPIELWVCNMLDSRSAHSCTIAARIETAPLDLARAAFALAHPAMARAFLYGIGAHQFGFRGHWPYDKHGQHRPHMAAILAPAFTHVTETLCIPGAHLSDPSVTNPAQWLEDQLAKHAPQQLDA